MAIPQHKRTKLVTVKGGCPECAGAGIVPHHHITNKRNKKQCPVCKGEGEVLKQIEVPA